MICAELRNSQSPLLDHAGDSRGAHNLSRYNRVTILVIPVSKPWIGAKHYLSPYLSMNFLRPFARFPFLFQWVSIAALRSREPRWLWPSMGRVMRGNFWPRRKSRLILI